MDISSGRKIYFDEFEVDLDRRAVLRAGEVLPLNPKAFDLLLALIERRGSPVSKDELLDRVWPGQFVEENNLTVHVSALRKLFGEKKNEHRYIITVPGRGYKFIGELREPETEILPTAKESPESLSDRRTAFDVSARAERPDRRWLVAISLVSVLALGAAGFFLWRGSERPGDVAVNSIAILPFKPLVADARDEALELGISDSLISGFSRLEAITVRPISAVRRYTDLEQDARAAGLALGVDAVLDGNIQRTGDRIRVSARLVRVDNGKIIWAETFDEKFTDIFAVQDSISQRMIAALALQLSGDEREDLVKKYTANTDAYHLYLKGRFFWSKLTPEGLQKSIDFYTQAIEIDPNYALAYAGLADSYNLLGSYGFWPLKESHPKARAAAEKALAIDRELGEAHASLAAVIADYYWDWAAADDHFQRAIELNPNYPLARSWYSQQLARMGRVDEAVEEAIRARELDPLSTSAIAHVGLALLRARRYDEAIAELKKALELDPRALDAHIFLGFVYVQQGRDDEAIAAFRTVVDQSGRNPSLLPLLGFGYASAGKRAEAEAILKEMSSGSERPFETALIYIGLGDHDLAFEWMEKAFEARAWQLGFLKVEPLFDPIRSDPRYTDLLRRIGLL